MFHKKNKKLLIIKWLYIVVAIFFIIALISFLSYFLFEKYYKDKIYPGVHIGNINMGGLTFAEAKKTINQKMDNINQNGIVFNYGNNFTTLTPLISSVEGDLAYRIIDFDIDRTINQAFIYGRKYNFKNNLRQKIKSLFADQKFYAYYSFNGKEVNKILTDSFSSLEKQAEDAKLIYNNAYPIKFDISEEQLGVAIDYEKGLLNLKQNLASLDNSPIKLLAEKDFPKIYKKDCLNIDAKANKILNKSPLTLKYKYKEWKIYKKELASWLILKPSSSEEVKDKVMVGLNPDIIQEYIIENIAPKVNKEPIDAKFEIKDGRVLEFQASHDGLEISDEATIKTIEYELLENDNNVIEVVTKELKSAIHTNEINDLGIKEIIGTGESDFSGSPKNRRHNIKVGADTLNGLLIKPDEEFSLVTTLGEIDAEAGYLPELVIKDNRTIPEFGGGLCQIGTTMFRTALATGLPITMRRNHSYRVSYYEPAGTDATIYNSWPDMKFINDTNNYILIQSRIEGDDLYFDFWGTKDGRIVENTEPTIYNIVRPGPTKLIETLDLPVGEKKCTEHAHNGADAYFDYTVTYPAKEDMGDSEPIVKEKRFSSHYVPWREVCLIGVEELSSEKEKTASSTPETASTN